MQNLEKYRAAFIKGDNTPLKDIFLDYHDDIIRIVMSKKLKVTEDQLEGHINEAMIIFYENIVEGKLTETPSIKNYIVGICINLVLRQNDSKLRIEKKIDEVRLHMYNNYHYVSNEENNDVMKNKAFLELAKLSKKCQTIIKAYYIDGLNMKEIAKYLSLASGDVAKTLKSRCFKQLMNNIKSERYETS